MKVFSTVFVMLALCAAASFFLGRESKNWETPVRPHIEVYVMPQQLKMPDKVNPDNPFTFPDNLRNKEKDGVR